MNIPTIASDKLERIQDQNTAKYGITKCPNKCSPEFCSTLADCGYCSSSELMKFDQKVQNDEQVKLYMSIL